MIVNPPFSPDQIDSINDYQESQLAVPILCENDASHGPLKAYRTFLSCRVCTSHTYWVYTHMADWSWLTNFLSAKAR